MKTAEYLHKLRALAKRPTVYAVAKMMGFPQDHVRAWYRGKSRPDPLSCVRIAELLQLDPLKVIADIEAERVRDEAKRRRWRRLVAK